MLREWEAKYRSYLTAEAGRHDPATRVTAISWLCLPWMAPILVGGVIALIFSPTSLLGRVAVIVLGSISVAGILYMSCVFAYQGIKLDLRRLKERQEAGKTQSSNGDDS